MAGGGHAFYSRYPEAMLDVLSGFAVVIIVMALGFVVGRLRLLGSHAVYAQHVRVLDRAAHVADSFSFDGRFEPPFWSQFRGSGPQYCARRNSRLRGLSGFCSPIPTNSLVAMLASSYCNGTHLGIPLMVHLLDDPTVTLPVVMFQVGFYGPLSVLTPGHELRRSGTARHRPRIGAIHHSKSVDYRCYHGELRWPSSVNARAGFYPMSS